MAVLRLGGRRGMIHSPAWLDDALVEEIQRRGEVAYIVAPGNFHHRHVAPGQKRFPEAETRLCPGVAEKRPDLRYTGLLDDRPVAAWVDELDQVIVRGGRWIREAAFLPRSSRTRLLGDVIENIGDHTAGVNWVLKLWWKGAFRMWNRPLPAPDATRMERPGGRSRGPPADLVVELLAHRHRPHGDLIEVDAQAAAHAAWRSVLGE